MTLIRLPIEMTTEGRDLSDGAVRTFLELCAWSMQGLLDGAIPIKDVPRLANTADPDAAITELVDRGWIVEQGDSLRVRMSQFPLPTINRVDHSGDWFGALQRCMMWNERVTQKQVK